MSNIATEKKSIPAHFFPRECRLFLASTLIKCQPPCVCSEKVKEYSGIRPAIQNRQFHVSYVSDSELERGKNVRDLHMVLVIYIVISTHIYLYLQLFKTE